MLTSTAHAQEVAQVQVKEVVVTATRTETEAEDIPATVTSITSEEVKLRQPADASDLFKDEPDIAFGRDIRRFGAARPNIRGIEDNRVVQMVDGVRLPNFYNGGGPTNFTMSAPMGPSLEFLRRTEILRGPASSLYGSDAIGGVVGFLTLEPYDLLEPGRNFGARASIGYTGANDGVTGALLGAGGSETAQLLLGYSHTEASEFDNQGNVGGTSTSRTKPNPEDVRDRGVIAKLLLNPSSSHKIGLSVEGRKRDSSIEVLRLSPSLPKVTATSGEDETERLRGTVEWQHTPEGGWYDRVTARAYRQTSETRNFNVQTRTNTSATCSAAAGAGNNCRIDQYFSFDQTLTGGSVQMEKVLGARHFLTGGIDIWRLETKESRDADVFNLTTGTTSKALAGDNFPLRDFAPGHTDTLGLFIQDEISDLAGGKLTLTPGLRYDVRRLKPEVDALSKAVLESIDREAVSQTDSALSPKLGALWAFSPTFAGYGQIVRGFRAPNYEEVNGHFRNTAQSYAISPNPDLDPETSTGVEVGLRLNSERLRGQIAAYDNRYRNFISNVRLNCPGDPNCVPGIGTTFMSVNLTKVRIYGVEARFAWEWAPGWRLDGAIAYAHGTDESADQPLDSVEPTRATLAVVRDAGTWGGEARLRAAAGVKRVNDMDGNTESPWFRPPNYQVLDVAAWLAPIKGLRLSVAVNNVFDSKYWLWSDIRMADSRNPIGVDFYSQPGRNIAARLEYTF
ncbi:MAG: TonB-dependent hemoglobin/transferrin/lactoferrin family receptor [Burkholderiales bacterium]|nr:TonB-dependent hemoglobin/transferrin/lactoferrin family receptor [Burkholderiales bacterium]